MFPINRKVPSFSLIEILVVMLLSGIVVGIIYFSYYNISRYQTDLSRRFNTIGDVSLLYALLKKDFDRSKVISLGEDQSLHCQISTQAEVVYWFDNAFVLRKQHDALDTFKFRLGPPVFLWQGKPLEELVLTVDEVRFDLPDSSPPVVVSVFKSYDAASRIEMFKHDSL